MKCPEQASPQRQKTAPWSPGADRGRDTRVTADGRSFLCSGDMLLKWMELMAAGLMEYSKTPTVGARVLSGADHTPANLVASLAWFYFRLSILFLWFF